MSARLVRSAPGCWGLHRKLIVNASAVLVAQSVACAVFLNTRDDESRICRALRLSYGAEMEGHDVRKTNAARYTQLKELSELLERLVRRHKWAYTKHELRQGCTICVWHAENQVRRFLSRRLPSARSSTLKRFRPP